MNLEHRPKKIYKPGDVIDLSQFNRPKRFEKKKNPHEVAAEIREAMPGNVSFINERISGFKNAPHRLLDEYAQINIKHYAASKSGPYKDDWVETDARGVKAEREAFAKDEIRDGVLGEEVIFILMNKIAGERYVVVKSSEYDDYTNGTDLVLVDTETGKTVCAFDDLIGNEQLDSQRSDKKSRYCRFLFSWVCNYSWLNSIAGKKPYRCFPCYHCRKFNFGAR